MIAESTPFGGIDLKQASNNAKSFFANNRHDYDDPWDRWFGKVMDIIDKYDISMWCYVNCDWESQPMWHNVGFGETRLSSNEFIMSKWQENIVNNGVANRTFLNSGSLENCGVFADSYGGTDVDDTVESTEFGESGSEIWVRVQLFILVPFFVVSGAFFVPYFILGGHKSKCRTATKRERRPLLSGLNNIPMSGTASKVSRHNGTRGTSVQCHCGGDP